MTMNGTSPRLPSGSGARGDVTRRHNLSTVLTLLHRGSQPRSQLTARTGLNRSTVAALIAELAELGLAYESEPDPTRQVGRPSPMAHADPRAVAIAVNPEVDAITIGVVGLDGRVAKRIRYETEAPPTVREFIKLSSAIIEGLRGEFEANGTVVGIGVAVPGLVRAEDGLVRLAPHLGWVDEPMARMLADATGLPVQAANDASLGAMAERVRGAGRGVDDLVYLNGGASGIGGGIIAGGQLLRGTSGFAGEIGHTLVNSAGIPCHCGSTGCLETEVSRAPLLDVLGLSPTESERLDEALAAHVAEPAVTALVDRQLGFLARALANVVNTFNPRRIVLGGFLASLYAAHPERLLADVRGLAMEGLRESVELAPATLGADLLAVGAAEIAFAALIADPAAGESRVAASASL